MDDKARSPDPDDLTRDTPPSLSEARDLPHTSLEPFEPGRRQRIRHQPENGLRPIDG
jgi:hypothetical protein